MNNREKISIIMPAYNAQKYIKEAIDCILSQTYDNIELIIADDGSTDNTKSIINSYNDKRIVCSHNDSNQGITATVNRLIKLATGDYITIHAADDISVNNRFELLINKFKSDSNLGMVGSWAEIVAENGDFIDFDKRVETDDEIKKELKNKSAFCGATVMVTREVIEDVGGYRDYFENLGYQDYDWTYMISDKYKVYNIQKPLYKYRQVPHSRAHRVDPKRVISDKLVKFLAKQREENGGIDCLMEGKDYIVNDYMNKLLTPYNNDSSLIYREFAAASMYHKMYKKAIDLSIKAIMQKPTKIVNWRTLFYCLRKSLYER